MLLKRLKFIRLSPEEIQTVVETTQKQREAKVKLVWETCEKLEEESPENMKRTVRNEKTREVR